MSMLFIISSFRELKSRRVYKVQLGSLTTAFTNPAKGTKQIRENAKPLMNDLPFTSLISALIAGVNLRDYLQTILSPSALTKIWPDLEEYEMDGGCSIQRAPPLQRLIVSNVQIPPQRCFPYIDIGSAKAPRASNQSSYLFPCRKRPCRQIGSSSHFLSRSIGFL